MADTKFYYSKGSFDSVSTFKSSIIKMTSAEVEGYLKNKDFSNWLAHSLGEKKLAEDVAKISTRKELLESFRKPKTVSTKPAVKKPVAKKTVTSKTVRKVSKPVKKPAPPRKAVATSTAKPESEKPVSETPKPKESFRMPTRESKISYISTESPNVFVLKEFLFGALFGLMLGLILMAMLISSGIYY